VRARIFGIAALATVCVNVIGSCSPSDSAGWEIDFDSCSRDAECPDGQYCRCVFGCSCQPGCGSDADCGPHSYCAEYLFAFGGQDCLPGCKDDSECAEDQGCRGHQCADECTMHADCLEDGALCALPSEATVALFAACGADAGALSPCPPGERCFCVSCPTSRDASVRERDAGDASDADTTVPEAGSVQ
jgi:hypothetical protein